MEAKLTVAVCGLPELYDQSLFLYRDTYNALSPFLFVVLCPDRAKNQVKFLVCGI